MVGSLMAAGTAGSKAAAEHGDRLRCFVFATLVAPALLVACTTSPPQQATVVPEPAGAAELPAAPVASPVPELPKLNGLGAAELVAMLGEPDFRRRDPPAEFWQYRSADCVLDVFLYSNTGGYRVVHSETHDRHALPLSAGACGRADAFADRQWQSRL